MGKRKTKEGIYIPNQDHKNPTSRYKIFNSNLENANQRYLELERQKKLSLKKQ